MVSWYFGIADPPRTTGVHVNVGWVLVPSAVWSAGRRSDGGSGMTIVKPWQVRPDVGIWFPCWSRSLTQKVYESSGRLLVFVVVDLKDGSIWTAFILMRSGPCLTVVPTGRAKWGMLGSLSFDWPTTTELEFVIVNETRMSGYAVVLVRISWITVLSFSP